MTSAGKTRERCAVKILEEVDRISIGVVRWQTHSILRNSAWMTRSTRFGFADVCARTRHLCGRLDVLLELVHDDDWKVTFGVTIHFFSHTTSTTGIKTTK